MRSRSRFSLFDVALFALVMAGLAYVPSSELPKAAWAILLGAYNLAVYLIQLMRKRRFLDADVARLLGAAVFISAGIAMWLGLTSPVAPVSIMIGGILLTGLVWSAFYATATAPETPQDG